MTRRLPRLTLHNLDVAQRALYASITSGDRAKGVQHFPLVDEDGSLHGPFGVMLHAPRVGTMLERLGAAIRFGTNLPARCREIAVLQVAQVVGSEFEWWAHERVGKAVGLTDDELMALAHGTFQGDDPVESAVVAFCRTLLTSHNVTDREFVAASAVLSNQQLVELTVLVGYYRILAQLMSVFDIGAPAGERTPLA